MNNDNFVQAFPIALPKNTDGSQITYMGMSLRDYFAAKAMRGLMGRNWAHHKGSDEELFGVWSASAYAVADAMMEARNVKGK